MYFFVFGRPELFGMKTYSELTYLQDICTSPINLAGLPAISVPVGYTRGEVSDRPLSNTMQDSNDELGSFKENVQEVNRVIDNIEDRSGKSKDSDYNLTEDDIVGAYHGISGLPISLQLIGKSGSDDFILRVAAWLEKELNVPKIVLDDPLG